MLPRGARTKLIALVELDPKIRVMPDLNTMDDLAVLQDTFDLFIVEAHVPGLTPADVESLHAAGLKVWHNVIDVPDFVTMLTCNPSPWHDIIDLGVDVIQTDYPEFLGPIFKGVVPER